MLGFLFRRKPAAEPVSVAAPASVRSEAELLQAAGTPSELAAGAQVTAPAGKVLAWQVVAGSVRTVAQVGGRTLSLATHNPGDWFGSGDAEVPAEPAVAVAPTRLLAFTPTQLASLPASAQAAAWHALARANLQASRFLSGAVTDLDKKNRLLAANLERGAGPSKDDYLRCEMVNTLLDAIPRLPLYATELVATLRDEETSGRRVAQVVEQDPSLAAAVLKEVNSAEYGLSGTVSDIHHGIMLLGFNQIYQLVLAQGVWQSMPDEPAFRQLRSESLVLSQVAYELGRICGEAEPATLGTIGLLHNLGRSLVLLLRRRNPKFDLLIDLLDHAKLASLLLERWHLPERICATIEWQRHPEFAPPTDVPESCRRNVALLYAAGLCAELVRGDSSEHVAGLFLEEYLAELDLTVPKLRNWLADTIAPALRRRAAAR